MSADRIRPTNCQRKDPPRQEGGKCQTGRIGDGRVQWDSPLLFINNLQSVSPPIENGTCHANSCMWHAGNEELHQQVEEARGERPLYCKRKTVPYVEHGACTQSRRGSARIYFNKPRSIYGSQPRIEPFPKIEENRCTAIGCIWNANNEDPAQT